MERSFEVVFVEQCAPTMAGLKPSNLFSFRSTKVAATVKTVSAWNERLRTQGLSVRILKHCSEGGYFLIYVYRISWIESIVSEKANREFLVLSGYTISHDFETVLSQFSERLKSEKRFPHEIGIFLGYPLNDVIGFIQNEGRNYSCCGCWKCYDDPSAAQECYERYRKCFSIYIKMFENGIPISKLIVAS